MWLGNIAVEMGEELYFEVLKRQIGYIYTKLLVSGENKPQHTNKYRYTWSWNKSIAFQLIVKFRGFPFPNYLYSLSRST